MGEVVTIPRSEYEFLRECARVLYEDVREQFRPEFVRRVLRAKGQVAQGKGVTLRSTKQLRDYLDAL